MRAISLSLAFLSDLVSSTATGQQRGVDTNIDEILETPSGEGQDVRDVA